MKHSMHYKIVFFILCLALIAFQHFGASINVSVSPQRGKNKIEVGDIFYINIVVNDIAETPERPSVNGAKLVYFDRTSQQSNFTSVNGVTSQNFTYTYTATLKAEKEGSYTFGPISVGGIKSNTAKFSIGSQSTASSAGSSSNKGINMNAIDDDSKPMFIGKGDSNLFLKASVSSSNAYEQEALVYTVKLYTTYDAIKFIGATESPKFDGFVVEESQDTSKSLSIETYQGKSYATAIIARYIIFPQIAGDLKVTGNTYTISVDRREYFHDAFWGNMSYSTPLQLNVTPNDLTINVKPLPAPKPADFSGGVGQFSITSELKNSNFKTNQAASIIYTVKGSGNVKYVQLPDLSSIYPPELEIYTPKTTQNIQVGGSDVTGSVIFDYSFMPLEEGSFKIPDVNLVYFNPVSGKYETSTAKGYSITVTKGAENASTNKNLIKFDNNLQKVNSNNLRKQIVANVYSFLYWLWYIIPAVILISAFLFYNRYNSLHADMLAFNSRRADKIARKRLRKAAAAMKANNKNKFYDELLTALWGYLGDKLKMPTSELFRDNVRQVLVSRHINEDLINQFIDMIDKAEFAKYSSSADNFNLTSAYTEAVDTINKLEKEFK